MDISGQVLYIFIPVHQHRFEPPLEQMTEASSFSIEIHGITDPFHRGPWKGERGRIIISRSMKRYLDKMEIPIYCRDIIISQY